MTEVFICECGETFEDVWCEHSRELCVHCILHCPDCRDDAEYEMARLIEMEERG